ncbi:helix-turn-helix domain-containing protein [Lichenihabitans sp. Uapishka_5]|uniref:helix-turn-helix domain-containing protein n=1 Tax=Lichenihabitans sp. Uapishka_5 TaxID=3037302 RepID=UPI0029E826DE|nr:helix-turn-helix domain-containing protein [Lichenihabitans sp. Uapishka_5]MDX7953463.1 helix-turn-helix domain-containing protein [Lichenihabitans sp. Uapishka_5]
MPLDRNAKARIMVLARAKLRRDAPGRHYGPVTAKAYAVLEALLWAFHNARTGLCFPSYETIAGRAGCARSTVALAIKALEGAGILTWVNRLRRVKMPAPAGWRWRVLRTSNGYRFTDMPEAVPSSQMAQENGTCAVRLRSKSEDPSGTKNQGSFSTDAPSRRGIPAGETPLDAALARLRGAVQRRQPIST